MARSKLPQHWHHDALAEDSRISGGVLVALLVGALVQLAEGLGLRTTPSSFPLGRFDVFDSSETAQGVVMPKVHCLTV
jgi:hypothetical protein